MARETTSSSVESRLSETLGEAEIVDPSIHHHCTIYIETRLLGSLRFTSESFEKM
jgi:hypothetical protein